MIPKISSVPAIDVDTETLIAEASTLAERARKMRSAVQAMKDTWATLPVVFEMAGTEAIYAKLDRPVEVVVGYADAIDTAAAALESFAITVAELQRQRDDLLVELDGARIREQNAEDNPDDPFLQVSDDDTDALRGRINGLQSSFEQAEDDCAATLRGINGGTGDGLPEAAGAFLVWGPSPRWVSQAEAFSAEMGDGVIRTLTHLSSLSETDAAAWVAANPDFVDAATIASPPPAEVAAWWNGIGSGTVDENGVSVDSAQQTALITLIPGVIGNLGGVTYKSRDKANELSLAAEKERLLALRQEVAASSVPRNRTGVTPRDLLIDSGFWTGEKADLDEAIAAIESIERTLDADPTNNRSLIQYTPGIPPLAAIAVGNLDTASQVTTLIPGMGTTVAKSMEAWTIGAENLQTEQRKRIEDLGGETSVATVAWIGYDSPTATSVLSSDLAEAGAINLVSFLESAATTRGTPLGQDMSTWGHSFGTTVMTLALSKTPVENATLVASAGVDESIPHVSDLRVDPKNVWTTEADQDLVANIGRGSLELGHWIITDDIPTDHPVNPNAAKYGANFFTSEASVLGSATDPQAPLTHLYATEGHGSTRRIEDVLKDNMLGEYGYLDLNTTSLYNQSLTTLGYGQNVIEEEHEPTPTPQPAPTISGPR